MFHFPLGLCRITNHTILRSVACPNNSEVRIIIRNFKPLYETVVYEYTTMLSSSEMNLLICLHDTLR